MGEQELRRVGRSGLEVSAIGLGCNNFGRRLEAADAVRVVEAAIDEGITLFDTADLYSGGRSEEIVGQGVRTHRDSVVVATKFGGAMGASPYRRGGSRRWIRIAVEESLRRLGTDWIDLYQLHFPDPATPMEETLETLSDLVHEGKVRYIGSSNLSGWQLAHADWTARTHGFEPFISAQNLYNLIQREAEADVIPACEQYGLGLIPYYPLGGGLLTGKYRRGEAAPEGTRLQLVPDHGREMLQERNFDVVDRLREFAAAREVSLLHVVLGGLAAQPCVVSVIAGAMSPQQVAANVAAGRWTPSEEDRAALRKVLDEPAPTLRRR
jgi:aryl-alcohol dehydrogenase-like predicted oxidoreductase